MSLVLNTNSSEWNIWTRMSNSMLWTYPDFTQILFKPNCMQRTVADTSFITSEQSQFSVNWTVINMISSNLSEARNYLWTNTAWDYGWYWFVNFHLKLSWSSWSTITLPAQSPTTIWCLWHCEWWEIIWKTVFRRWWIYAYTYNQSHRFKNIVLWMTAWLLHSDWTITRWTTYTKTISEIGWYGTYIDWVAIYGQSSWIVAMEWDMVIAKIEMVSWQFYWAQTWTNQEQFFWIIFWSDWSSNGTQVWSSWYWRCSPLQISIE